MNQVYDVLVCGAGPVGLFFAYQMIKLGHSVYIHDLKSGPTTQSRAFFITARSLEMFENKGIAKHLLKKAYVLRGAQLIIEGCEVNSVVPDDMGDTVFPQLTSVPQSDTESILASMIQETQAIHWNTKLVDYVVQDDVVIATVTKDNGKTTETVRAKYIIGADGSHSSVRSLDKTWTYKGFSSNTRFGLADVVLSGSSLDMVKDKYNIFYHTEGMFLLIPINYNNSDNKKNLFRIIFNRDPYDKIETNSNDEVTHGILEHDPYHLTIDDVNDTLKQRADPLDLTASDPQWLTHFYINERKANGFRHGKAFLIGDAAHCHSPVGGQGMNLGLQDADNLAWKLSLVLNGKSSDPELLLDSYTIEREPIAEEVISQTGSATELAMSVGFVIAIFRYFVYSSNFAKLKEYGLSTMLQLNMRIENSSPLLKKSDPSLIKAGTFLPETSLLLRRSLNTDSDTLCRKTLRQIVYNNQKHTALFVGTRPASYQPCPFVSAFYSKLKSKFQDAIRPLVVESNWHISEYKLPENVLNEIKKHSSEDVEADNFWLDYTRYSAEDSITKHIGLENAINCSPDQEPPAALVIVRPDLYVSFAALVQTEQDIDDALSFLHTYLK